MIDMQRSMAALQPKVQWGIGLDRGVGESEQRRDNPTYVEGSGVAKIEALRPSDIRTKDLGGMSVMSGESAVSGLAPETLTRLTYTKEAIG
jgi:hypothetical protein